MQGLVQAVRYLAAGSSPQRYENTGLGMEALRSGLGGRNMNGPPPYQGLAAPQRAHSPNQMEHGTVDEYTPLPRSQF